ncbi:Uma2 family endonuclease [Nostoc sp. FACHB-152]|uniref:Uma2 family endonuclease n=1 Tax=unclassified Nostoc TaxID=2593658 RepID=UPI0016884CF5|nr:MULTISPECIES: Uma2 family endonuclease [unclassified Nostoc]MBD2447010.1 Uma2 family endonuclease [Nostoc sp. FACHB-152]MBD2467653.1 Uma2 family endonuclease [Nostoc sp. FACHB-145]
MTLVKSQLTLQEFLALPEGDITYELVDGKAKPKMAPKRFHSRLTLTLSQFLALWAKNRGEVGIEWAVTLKRQGRDWVPVPDLLFVSYSRLNSDVIADEPCPIPPDLAIEIISPDQTFGEMSAKATDYLDAGVLRVWVVDAKAKTVTVFYPDARPQTKTGEDSLEDALLEGLQITPAQIFQQAGIP